MNGRAEKKDSSYKRKKFIVHKIPRICCKVF